MMIDSTGEIIKLDSKETVNFLRSLSFHILTESENEKSFK
jgi:hypothetical protein